MKQIVFISFIIINVVNSQDSRINRFKGSIITNLTSTQEFENNIVQSHLDQSRFYRMIYRGFREFYNMMIPNTGLRHNSSRFQKQIPNSENFPCDVRGYRSEKIPNSVHKLRPGDFDVIGAVGDSLTSATSANSQAIWEVLVENRGLSWCIGGQGTWRSHLTLPNILKEFNPNIFGYSLTDSFNVHKTAQFNVAENIATTSDMPYNVRKLLDRIKLDPRVNMKKHWKLITFMIGGNDFCSDICYQRNATQWINDVQERSLIHALRYLKNNSPRTLVNLVPSPLISLSFSMDRVQTPMTCYLARPIECSCLFGQKFSANRNTFRALERKFVKIMERVSFMPEFHSEDFTVVYQPFFKDASVFYTNDIKPDLSIMSIDCIHLSQKGHAVSANGLWNNMMEPVGFKNRGLNHLFEKFNCPSTMHPYVFTNYNSQN